MIEYQRYEQWLEQVPRSLKEDRLWSFETYRKCLFLADLAWNDCDRMMRDNRGKAIAHQLIRSAGSIAANIEEGFGRGYGKDYARFLRIALGSVRETRGWYYRGRLLLNEETLQHRLKLIEDIIGSLIIVSRNQAKR